MRNTIFIILATILFSTSCKTKKSITESNSHSYATLVDTTTTKVYESKEVKTSSDTFITRTNASFDSFIEFDTLGGTMIIDSAGVIKLNNIKSIYNNKSSSKLEQSQKYKSESSDSLSYHKKNAELNDFFYESTVRNESKWYKNKIYSIIISIIMSWLIYRMIKEIRKNS